MLPLDLPLHPECQEQSTENHLLVECKSTVADVSGVTRLPDSFICAKGWLRGQKCVCSVIRVEKHQYHNLRASVISNYTN